MCMEKGQTQTSTPREETQAPKKAHYYGDLVRKELFFAAFVIMVAALLDAELRNFYLFVGLFGVVGITILAGLTSRNNRFVMVLDTLIAAVMFLVFEYFAIDAFMQYGDFSHPIFFLRQLIAVTYLVILYYGTKTTRYYREQEHDQGSSQ